MSPAAAPEVRTTGWPSSGSISLVTPMDAPAERPSTAMTFHIHRQTLSAAPTKLVLPEMTGLPETVNMPFQDTYTPLPPDMAALLRTMPPPSPRATLPAIVPPVIVNALAV